MTVLNSSDSKSQSSSTSISNNSSNQTEDLLPTYSILNNNLSQQSQSQSQQASNEPGFVVESISTLNPESSKKLAIQSRESGEGIESFGFTFDSNELPPTFSETEYRPNYIISSDGNIISHDEALNSSPVALARFLRLHSSNSSPPSLSVQIRGSHTEVRTSTRFETDANGSRRVKTERKNVEVEDFDFGVDARNEVEIGLGKARGGGGARGILFPTGEFEVEHRGGCWKSIGVNEGDGNGRISLPIDIEDGRNSGKWRIAGFWEQIKLDKERKARARFGLPSFVHPESLVEITESTQNQSSFHPPLLLQSHFVDLVETHSSVPFNLTGISSDYHSLIDQREAREEEVRNIIEDYCNSTKTLKQLSVRKELYGWNWEDLETGIRNIIESTRYTGKVQIHFKISPTSLVIRPQNTLSQIFSLPVWAKIILWITLLYPILLVIEFFSGARYDNIRVAFPLCRWRILPIPNTSSSSSSSITKQQALELAKPLTTRLIPKVTQLPNGTYLYLIGTEENEWLKSWENGIIDAVRRGRRGGELTEVDKRSDR